MLFLSVLILVWLIYVFLYWKLAKQNFKWDKVVLPLLFLSILFTINFGLDFYLLKENMPFEVSLVSKWVLGYDNVTRTDLYLLYFRIALYSSFFLLLLQMATTLFSNRVAKQK